MYSLMCVVEGDTALFFFSSFVCASSSPCVMLEHGSFYVCFVLYVYAANHLVVKSSYVNAETRILT